MSQQTTAPFEMLGGEPVVRRLVDHFYRIMDESPQAATIRAMHAADLAPMRDKLFDYLVGWLGGPPRYHARPDAKCIMSAHEPYPIGAQESEQWMNCMRQALNETGVSVELRKMLEPAFDRVAKALRNR
jgi:hemoglobin